MIKASWFRGKSETVMCGRALFHGCGYDWSAAGAGVPCSSASGGEDKSSLLVAADVVAVEKTEVSEVECGCLTGGWECCCSKEEAIEASAL